MPSDLIIPLMVPTNGYLLFTIVLLAFVTALGAIFFFINLLKP